MKLIAKSNIIIAVLWLSSSSFASKSYSEISKKTEIDSSWKQTIQNNWMVTLGLISGAGSSLFGKHILLPSFGVFASDLIYELYNSEDDMKQVFLNHIPCFVSLATSYAITNYVSNKIINNKIHNVMHQKQFNNAIKLDEVWMNGELENYKGKAIW